MRVNDQSAFINNIHPLYSYSILTSAIGDELLCSRMSNSSNLEDELALVSVNESNSSTYDILLKIMALGDTGVGKSCFLVQYVEGRFMMKYVTTVGVDFFLRKLVSHVTVCRSWLEEDVLYTESYIFKLYLYRKLYFQDIIEQSGFDNQVSLGLNLF